jgi:hypothetical protein
MAWALAYDAMSNLVVKVNTLTIVTPYRTTVKDEIRNPIFMLLDQGHLLAPPFIMMVT